MELKNLQVSNNDIIWVSKDMVCPFSTITLGEYYCVNDDGKLELYEDQVAGDYLCKLIHITFDENTNRKWYQIWKPKRIINGYSFMCISLKRYWEE